MTETARIPLRNRAGEVIAYTLVDADLYPELARWRWSLGDTGYVVRSIQIPGGRQQKLRLHRVVMGCTTGDGLEVDHINRDRLDNRRANLRFVTRQENIRNGAPYLATHCKHGHERTPENLIRGKGGSRECRVCKNDRRRRLRAKAAA